jgi:hypothetical protein
MLMGLKKRLKAPQMKYDIPKKMELLENYFGTSNDMVVTSTQHEYIDFKA